MRNHTLTQDEFDEDLFRDEEQKLHERLNAIAAIRQKHAAEQGDTHSMLPPSELVQSIEKMNAHNELVSKTQDRNIRREQKRGVLLMLALISATATLVCWGLRLMHGG